MRAVIYVPEGVEASAQIDQLLTYCHTRHHDVVGVAHTLTAAEQVFALVEADVFVLTSRRVLPWSYEMISEEIGRHILHQGPPNPLVRRERPRRLR